MSTYSLSRTSVASYIHHRPRAGTGVVVLVTAVLAHCAPEPDCATTATCPPDPELEQGWLADASRDGEQSPRTLPDAQGAELSAVGSGGRDQPAADQPESSASSTPVRCAAPRLSCGSSCIDSRSDVNNCGDCGVKCPAIGNSIAVCEQGMCGARCIGGGTLCGSTCVNIQEDENHCGACDNHCQAPRGGSARCRGVCQAVCAPDQLLCDQACVAIDDIDHCGSCQRRCEAPQPGGSGSASCSNGTCVQKCSDERLLCHGTCCPAPPPNEQATCDENRCGSVCLVAPLQCADGRRPCGGWNFESGQPEGWAVYPYEASAWDRAPLVNVDWPGGRALAAGFNGNGDSQWLLSLEVPLCGNSGIDLTGKTVHATVGLRSMQGHSLTGEATAELWATERVVTPTELTEGKPVRLLGTAQGPATSLSIDFKINQPWRGQVIIDDVYIE